MVEHFFPNTFDVVFGERPDVPRKPDPQIVHDILIHLGTSQQIWYIGDSLVDVETARNAQLPVIACTWGFCSESDLEAAHPDYIARHPADILPIIG